MVCVGMSGRLFWPLAADEVGNTARLLRPFVLFVSPGPEGFFHRLLGVAVGHPVEAGVGAGNDQLFFLLWFGLPRVKRGLGLCPGALGAAGDSLPHRGLGFDRLLRLAGRARPLPIVVLTSNV